MKPYAVFAYIWPAFNQDGDLPFYRVMGGPSDGSDVCAETLIELGIPIPSRVLGNLTFTESPQHAATERG
jgi:hypothetical protein